MIMLLGAWATGRLYDWVVMDAEPALEVRGDSVVLDLLQFTAHPTGEHALRERLPACGSACVEGPSPMHRRPRLASPALRYNKGGTPACTHGQAWPQLAPPAHCLLALLDPACSHQGVNKAAQGPSRLSVAGAGAVQSCGAAARATARAGHCVRDGWRGQHADKAKLAAHAAECGRQGAGARSCHAAADQNLRLKPRGCPSLWWYQRPKVSNAV